MGYNTAVRSFGATHGPEFDFRFLYLIAIVLQNVY